MVYYRYQLQAIMADLPIHSIPIDTSHLKNTSHSQAGETTATGSHLLDEKSSPIPSQVLSKSPTDIVLSLPSQSPLRVELPKDSLIASQLAIGDKVNLRLIHDKNNIILTITPQPPKSDVVLSVPISIALTDALAKQTSLPIKDELLKAHLSANSELLLGQARKLPQEKITLKVSETITIKAQLPGINALPANKTMQASLTLNNDKQLTVQFSHRPTPPSSIQILLPLQQLAASNSNVSLSCLPILNVSNVQSHIDDSSPMIQITSKLGAIDMSKPLNQLWLRHQPSSQIISALTNSLDTVNALNHHQLKAESNQLQHPQVRDKADAQAPKNDQKSEQSANVTIQTSNKADIAPKVTPPQANTSITPLPLRDLGDSNNKATAPASQSNIPTSLVSSKSPSLHVSESALPNMPKEANTSAILNEPKAPVAFNVSTKHETTPAETKINPVPNSDSAKTLKPSDLILPSKADNLTPKNSAAKQTSPETTTVGVQASHTNSNAVQTEKPTTPLSLQKLNSLISLLSAAPSNAPKQVSAPDHVINSNDTENSPDFVAAEQLKAMAQRLKTQLPAMGQLTNAAQLSHMVEQFTRFEPLSSASVNLSSLGPLASALQLMLGGRHVANGNSPSPQLLKHLSQLVKQTRGASASNLTSALQLLGNLQSFKPLEEALSNISSNIQFYQYQNAEQQQNNSSLFYFNLPTKESQVPQIEGEVEEQNASKQHGEKSWRLTLLLPCGDVDKIKVNALLTGNGVELDLTCNNQSLVERANFYKAFLANRLESLGFDKPKVTCQQGEIPTTLLKRPNQLVELMI